MLLKMNNIAIIIGTRPEYIKCLPLLKSSNRYKLVYVQQHTDLVKLDLEHEIVPIQEYGENRLNNIISSILHSRILDKSWDAIMVQGDTVVAFAAALSAFNKNIEVIHLEAGLRTYDTKNPFPEEGYRKMIDCISSYGLCPSHQSVCNNIKEGFCGQLVNVGNTSIDAIAKYNLIPKITNKVLVTLHRRENWDIIEGFFEAIEFLANKYTELEFILPIHPNPLITKHASIFKKVKVIQPLDHKSLCIIMADCNTIISDSGGIQEEAAYLGKKIFCCRKTTERSELLDTYVILTPTPEILINTFLPQTSQLPKSLVYGDGDSCIKINEFIENM
jgi:UDP-N-acetylglucosamine 2-epimerase (non-hydrolysing)